MLQPIIQSKTETESEHFFSTSDQTVGNSVILFWPPLLGYLLSIEDNSLAIRKNADGMCGQEILLSPESSSCRFFSMGVGQESSTILGSRLLIDPCLQSKTKVNHIFFPDFCCFLPVVLHSIQDIC